MAKRVKEPAPAEEIVKAEEPAVFVMEAETLAPASAAKSGPTIGQRVKRFFVILLRTILTLMIAAVVGVALYFGVPFVYQKYILPVQENTEQLAGLQTRQSQSEQAVADLQARLNAMETAQAQSAQSMTELDARVDTAEEQIAAHTQMLAALEEMEAALQVRADDADTELARQIKLLKSMELLSRARMFLYQSNFGMARQDIQTARALLIEVQADSPASLTDDLDEVIHRLDLTLSNLPNFPVAARDDLDIAWQVLLAGLPPDEATATPAPGAEAAVTPTPPATATPTATP
ncbi:MAG: hypothetical protein ACOYZ8_02585 [Chloroflexota bacterium]